MFEKWFSRRRTYTAVPGFEKAVGFINYLTDRQIIDTLVQVGDSPSLPADKLKLPVTPYTKRLDPAVLSQAITCFTPAPGGQQLAGYENIVRRSRYFIMPGTGNHSAERAASLQQMGLTFFEGKLESEQPGNAVIIGGADVDYAPCSSLPRRIVALMHVFNEEDILGETIRFLLDQGLHVHIIDNWSTDGSWEIAGNFPEDRVSRERFPEEGPTGHYEWFKQLEYSELLAEKMPFDWFIHYDADEFRYAPWKGITLQNAISFIDRLGYNAIDFTVLDFRYTEDNDQVREGFERQNTWFEFGKRPGHFLQAKGWKKQPVRVDLKNGGGHNVQFPGRKLYPIKFLNKHYSLRSREQAEKKLVQHRLPRVQKELAERSWHSHINTLISQQAEGWKKEDLIEWTEGRFDSDYLLERISGVGILKP